MRQTFQIPWEPTAKGRPKFVRRTGAAYTPAQTRHAESAIRSLLMSAGAELIDRGVAIGVEMVFLVPRPASAPKRVASPIKRPDLDQYVKLLLDAATGVLWVDDSQVVTLRAAKAFAPTVPCQVLTVWDAEAG